MLKKKLMMKKPGGIITTRNFSQVLAKKGGNLGMVDNRGDSAVYWAARQGHQDVVQYLISQGVHVNQQNKVSLSPPSHLLISQSFHFILIY